MRYRWFFIICLVLLGQHVVAQEISLRACKVLYWEDFGGNDPDDPELNKTSLPNISVYQNAKGGNMKRGLYAITKKGVLNKYDNRYDITNFWYILDDHTYPDDYTRGYFLEVDGFLYGDDVDFYSTIIENVDSFAGQSLTISAYVTSLVNRYWADNDEVISLLGSFPWCFTNTNIEFDFIDVATNQKIASSGPLDISPGENWKLITFSIEIPEGVSRIRMNICTKGRGYPENYYCAGNDIAIDDIEIRLPFSSVPLIVNKYNWQLVCDNMALQRIFPGRTAVGFQWYKDGRPVSGATEDDYAEQDALHGTYQLCVILDDGLYVWSDIIEIPDSRAPKPVCVQIYDSRGMPVREDQVMHGIYLYRYEQGEQVWTEKKLIQTIY